MTVSELKIGQQATIVSVAESHQDAQRLAEIGFLPGTPLKIIGESPFGDAVILSLRGSRLAMRKSDARLIQVQMIEPEPESSPPSCQPQTSVPVN